MISRRVLRNRGHGAWIYNQVGANLTGILVVLLGLGIWRALSPDVIGRLGAAALIAASVSPFFDDAIRAGTVVVFVWIAFVGLRLWQRAGAVPQPP